MISKKLLVGASAFSMCLAPTTSILASENEVSNIPLLTSSEREDVSQTSNAYGTIEIQLEASETAKDLSNVKFGINQVAELVDGEYVLVNEFKDSGIDLNSLETSEQLQNASDKLTGMANTPETTITTDSSGYGKSEYLTTGVYLLTVINSANYDDIKTTLVSIPAYDETISGYNYDISVEPKHSPKKKQENKAENPDTGQNTNFNEYVALLGASLALLGALSVKKKAKTN